MKVRKLRADLSRYEDGKQVRVIVQVGDGLELEARSLGVTTVGSGDRPGVIVNIEEHEDALLSHLTGGAEGPDSAFNDRLRELANLLIWDEVQSGVLEDDEDELTERLAARLRRDALGMFHHVCWGIGSDVVYGVRDWARRVA